MSFKLDFKVPTLAFFCWSFSPPTHDTCPQEKRPYRLQPLDNTCENNKKRTFKYGKEAVMTSLTFIRWKARNH